MASVLVLLLAACGSNEGAAVVDTTTTSAPAPTSSTSTSVLVDPVVAQRQAVLDAYDAAIAAFVEAAAIPDENHPALEATHTGPMLQTRRESLARMRAVGQVGWYPEPSRYRVELVDGTMEIDGDVATFQLCGIDDGRVLDGGEPPPAEARVWTSELTVAMERVDGTWRLTERRLDDQQEGITGCAADWE